jgi:hypothetical protein
MIRVVLALLVLTGAARAERFALVVGNNAGDSDEPRLRYAEDDAHRIAEVLRELGGVRPEDLIVLRGEDAETVRHALIALNDRIRAAHAAELIVYYSGHADASALHLGRTAIELAQLEQLVRGSAASLRVLILDSCRSGALTRIKGGTLEPGFAISLDPRPASDGVIFWTASSASENAQESDALRGSFFTHYLISGLLGAADRDGNGAVSLSEAYAYSYENTLRATSRTLSGTQHPTYHYELGGRDDVVLTAPGRAGDARAQVSFPEGTSYLLIRDSADGAVVGEVGAHDRTRRLSVRPGRYFVRGRAADALLEGTVQLAPAAQVAIRVEDLDRVAYARLVRKGRGERALAASAQAGYAARTSLWPGGGLCHGPFAGVAFDLPLVTVASRLGVCRGELRNPFLTATTDELAAELRGAHVWDVGRVSLSVGVSLGGSVIRQGFSRDGIAPDRRALAAHLGVLTGASVELVQGFYAGLEVNAMTYFFNQQTMGELVLGSPFAMRFDVLLLGKHW